MSSLSKEKITDKLSTKQDELFASFSYLKETDTEFTILNEPVDPSQGNVDTSAGLLAEKIKQTKAEIDIIKSSHISVLPDSTQLKYEVLQYELERGISELTDTLTFINSEAREMEIEIQQDEELNYQLSECVVDSLTKRLDEQNFQTNDVEGAREKMKNEIANKKIKANAYFKQILKDSAQFCGKYFKLPTEQEFNEQQKKLRSADKTMTVRNMLSLKDIISELMNKCFDEPNQPYIILDKRYWPPYVELLLRCQIAVRHPDDPRRIKLIPFHL